MSNSRTNSKIISLCLTVALVLGVFAGMTIPVNAAPIGLSAPDNAHWEEAGANSVLDYNGYAVWDRVDGAVVYKWELYRNETAKEQDPDNDVLVTNGKINDTGSGSTIRTDLSSYITKTGHHYFIVCALDSDDDGEFTAMWSHSSYLYYNSNTMIHPNNPGGGSGGGSSGSGGSTTSSAPSNTPVNVTTSAATTAAKNAAEIAKAAGASTATANIKSPGDISLSALRAMAKEAGMPLTLQADSMTQDGKSVDVRITLDPALATQNLNLSASTSNNQSKATTNFFKKYFSNNVMTVSLGQQGSFGQSVEIAAKITPDLDTNNLVFYTYDKTSNTYVRIQDSNHWVDKNGYVHFTTSVGGNIVISSGSLVKK